MTWVPKKSVVVPVDFTDESLAAIKRGLELVDEPAHLHLVHVLYPLDVVSPGIEFVPTDQTVREEATKGYARKFLDDAGYKDQEIVIRLGDPGIEIARYADDVDAGLIVIPSHGRHGWKHFFLGSVTEHVLQHAHCEILVLRRHDAD